MPCHAIDSPSLSGAEMLTINKVLVAIPLVCHRNQAAAGAVLSRLHIVCLLCLEYSWATKSPAMDRLQEVDAAGVTTNSNSVMFVMLI